MKPNSADSAGALFAENIVYAYPNGSRALDGASFRAEPASVTMIVGRSGSGKTTLLKVLQGFLKPHAGTVERGASTPTSYIPQGLGLTRNATALRNVLTGALARVGLWRSLAGLFPSKIEREARELLARVGLAHKADARVANLSGGERQRVAIARALMRRPRFMLADEFVSQLDAVTSVEMLDLVRQTAGEGIGWVITTHDLDVAAAIADRVVALRAGKVALDRPGPALDTTRLLEAIS